MKTVLFSGATLLFGIRSSSGRHFEESKAGNRLGNLLSGAEAAAGKETPSCAARTLTSLTPAALAILLNTAPGTKELDIERTRGAAADKNSLLSSGTFRSSPSERLSIKYDDNG